MPDFSYAPVDDEFGPSSSTWKKRALMRAILDAIDDHVHAMPAPVQHEFTFATAEIRSTMLRGAEGMVVAVMSQEAATIEKLRKIARAYGAGAGKLTEREITHLAELFASLMRSKSYQFRRSPN